MPKFRWIALFGVSALVVAGCGHSNKGLSYSGLADEANEICKEGDAEIENKDATEAADIIEDKYLPRLRDLEAPDELQPSVDRFVKVTEDQIAAIRAEDSETLDRLTEESDLAASKMGAKECIG